MKRESQMIYSLKLSAISPATLQAGKYQLSVTDLEYQLIFPYPYSYPTMPFLLPSAGISVVDFEVYPE